MRSRFAFLLFAASSSTLFVLAAACGSSKDSSSTLPLVEGGGKKDSGDPQEEEDAEVADTYIPPGTPGRVYAHTKDTLYLFEPVSGDLKEIGKFSCLDPLDTNDVVVDLAVDRTGTVYATTFGRFLKVDPITAACTEIKKVLAGEPSYPNALSFVPAGTVDPTKEALVGYSPVGTSPDSTDYIRIDTATGVITKIGQLNGSPGTSYKSSGDLISLIQDSNRTFLTVKLLSDASVGTDLLAEVDPKTGNLKKIIGDTKQTNLYGFGYWAGKGYGFSDNGKISEIDMTTGNGTVVKTLTGDGGSPLPWYGAGVTTEAPITP
jgi:hypothetical protein